MTTITTRGLAAAACLALTATGSLWASSTPASAASVCDAMTAPLYQATKASPATSLVTPWADEYNHSTQYGYTQRGAIGQVATAPATGLVDVHRLVKGTDFVTAPATDVATWQQRGYTDQGTYFRAAPAGAGCGIAVHRVVDAAGRHQEVLEPQLATMTAAGWSDVGTKYRVNPATNPVPVPPVGTDADADGRFSLAVTPDTQNETLVKNAPLLAQRNQWLVAHKGAADLDLRAAIQVGDLTNWDTPDHAQFTNAVSAMSVLEKAGLPWVGAVGNHDAQATGEGGSARPGVVLHTALRDTTTYNSYLGANHFALRSGSLNGTEDNSVHTFTAGGAKWMVLVLEVWPRPEAIAWARQQLAAHTDTNVILVTHDYLDGAGNVTATNDGYGDALCTQVRDQLVAPYPNVKVVLSGHEGVGATRVDTFNGNKVLALQSNYANLSDNLTRILKIDVNAGTLTYDYRSLNSATVIQDWTTVDGMSWIR